MEITSRNRSKRMANIELLRILAMFMVVMLHYLSKGDLLMELTGPVTVNGYIAWGLETLSIAAVNIYMLISGFFLVSAEFKSRRLLDLLLQVFFYSLTIPIFLILTGNLSLGDLTIHKLLYYLLPTQMIHYWFVTAYVGMYLFAPLLSAAVRTITQKQLKTIILLLLIFYSVYKSILPVRLEMDNLGYDSIWFMCVFLIAAYIRLYGISFFKNARVAFTCFFASSFAIFTLTMIIRFVFLTTGQLETLIQVAYGYNHILNIVAAVSLFYAFYYMKFPENIISKWICIAAPGTFGVYLLHEHIEIRYLWPTLVGASLEGNSLQFLVRSLGGVAVVLFIGIIIDLFRAKLFQFFAKLFPLKTIGKMLDEIDRRMQGKRDC